jgi:hypothetical protein
MVFTHQPTQEQIELEEKEGLLLKALKEMEDI